MTCCRTSFPLPVDRCVQVSTMGLEPWSQRERNNEEMGREGGRRYPVRGRWWWLSGLKRREVRSKGFSFETRKSILLLDHSSLLDLQPPRRLPPPPAMSFAAFPLLRRSLLRSLASPPSLRSLSSKPSSFLARRPTSLHSPSPSLRSFTSSPPSLATTLQVCRLPRRDVYRRVKRTTRSPALEGCPQKKGVCVRVFTAKPKKPNSAVRSSSPSSLSLLTTLFDTILSLKSPSA